MQSGRAPSHHHTNSWNSLAREHLVEFTNGEAHYFHTHYFLLIEIAA
jgi:hypothetical protein